MAGAGEGSRGAPVDRSSTPAAWSSLWPKLYLPSVMLKSYLHACACQSNMRAGRQAWGRPGTPQLTLGVTAPANTYRHRFTHAPVVLKGDTRDVEQDAGAFAQAARNARELRPLTLLSVWRLGA